MAYFSTMKTMGVSNVFTRWVMIFFIDVSTAVYINKSSGDSFNIERRVRQCCHLTPHLLLIVGESLIFNITKPVLDEKL